MIAEPPAKDKILLRCPHCGARLVLESPYPGAPFDRVASVLVDHLLLVQDQLREIQRIVEEVVLP